MLSSRYLIVGLKPIDQGHSTRKTASPKRKIASACRRKRRGTRANRKFNWQHEDEYIGTNIQLVI